VDNSAPSLLAQGLERLNLSLEPSAQARLLAYVSELLKWNEKVSLTAITRTDEVVDKHLLDSLAVLPEIQGATHLLDLGAGAGLPGIPLAIALPSLRATLVDAVAKKVAFMKSGAVKGGVADRIKAIHARAEGHPEKEGLPKADLVISRAFMDVGPFLLLARAYLSEGGRVVTMMGQTPPAETLEKFAAAAGLELASRRTFTLPQSGDPRGVAVFHVKRGS
jgi:16S rRNA (guanine527-N7)-methyltransferase